MILSQLVMQFHRDPCEQKNLLIQTCGPPHSPRPSVEPSIPPLPPYEVWATRPTALIINQPRGKLCPCPHSGSSAHPSAKDSQVPSTSKQMVRPGWASLGDPSQAPQSQNKHNHPPVLPTQFVHLQRPTTLLCSLTCHRSPPSTHTDTGRSPPTAKQPHLILGALHTYRYSHSGLHTPGLG